MRADAAVFSSATSTMFIQQGRVALVRKGTWEYSMVTVDESNRQTKA